MKLLVSDYDNTFHIKDCDMKENVEKANDFRKDNLFVIATGRSYDSYIKAKEQFNIKTDYTIINHGGTILKGDKVIYNYSIENVLKTELKNLLQLDYIGNIYCYLGIEEVSVDNDRITKIIVRYEDEKIIFKLKKYIESKYYSLLRTYLFDDFKSLEIIPKEIDKSNAVEYISRMENIDDIYVIGDNYNDYLMIKNYGGSCTYVAVDEIKAISKNVYKNVSNFINELMEESK